MGQKLKKKVMNGHKVKVSYKAVSDDNEVSDKQSK